MTGVTGPNSLLAVRSPGGPDHSSGEIGAGAGRARRGAGGAAEQPPLAAGAFGSAVGVVLAPGDLAVRKVLSHLSRQNRRR